MKEKKNHYEPARKETIPCPPNANLNNNNPTILRHEKSSKLSADTFLGHLKISAIMHVLLILLS
jgi:hypothetical protein